ncbi:MAG TPA: trigger factor [Bacteroidia bacterium]|nr:trigger factor [Bacteroidia bacterium]
MNIQRSSINHLTEEITISLSPADYESRVNEGIKKVQRQASLPGFRPGKVPAGLIRKQYGTQIMVDEINKLLNDTIHHYIEEQKIEILGNPLPKEQASVDFAHQKDFDFVYELGLAPAFELNLDSKNTFTYKTVKVDEALVDKYLSDVRRNYGKPVYPEVSGEKDTIFVDLNELDADGNIKAGGIYKSTSFNPERIVNKTTSAKLLGLKKEDKLSLNVDDLFETALDKSVSLGLDKETAENTHCNLQLTVKNISRMEEAELNQELFDRIYGPDKINGLDAFRAKIREELGLMFSADSERFLKTEVESKLVEKINMQLPDAFLKRWLTVVNEKPISQEELEKDYPNYAKAMQWRLIENKIIKDNQIKVDQHEAVEEAKNFVKAEYARYGQVPTEEDLNKIAMDLLSKEKEAQRIFENLYSKKVLELIKEKCTLDRKELSYEEFFKP